VMSHGVAVAIAIAFAYFVTTSLHITVGEQVPKIYSIVHAEGTARRIARPLYWFRAIFKPFIWLLNTASNWILRLVDVDARAEFEDISTSEDLKMLIAQSASGGKIDPGEAGMLSGVFHLHEQQARQVMTPIPAVVTVDVSETVEIALKRCVESGHTRLVVTENFNTDRIKGVVHANSLVRKMMSDGPEASIESTVKDALIVPETKPLDDLLADLQRERASMAVVVDEYGRTAGIVSVEDIIEEVVGEIADETDPAVAGIRRLANGDWWVRGHVPITDLADYGLDLPVDSEAFNSVGGFVFGELGRLPKRGDMVRVNGYSLRVESVRENRIEAVRIRDHEPRADNGPGRAGSRPVERAASTPRGQEPREPDVEL
jgi:CBS domain containing-hemolysin-like protein